MTKINPYIHFKGNCKEAFEFYAQVLKGNIIAMMTYADMPPSDFQQDSALNDNIVHARLLVGDAVLMGSDSPPQYQEDVKGMSVSLMVDSPEEAERIYQGLQEGGQVSMPMEETFWAHRFAMLTDRFGIRWMINCEKPMSA